MMNDKIPLQKQASLEPSALEVGVVGLGLMGRSIVMCLLLAGHKVIAVAPLKSDFEKAKIGFKQVLQECKSHGRISDDSEVYESRLLVTESYADLSSCVLVVECVIEDLSIKKQVYKYITDVVSPSTIIGTNTSAIPISLLQRFVERPERFLGLHWAEPAYLTRFLEIICGEKTNLALAQWVAELAVFWGKEPTLLRRDIRGFVTNRLMYAVYRELFHLIEQEGASMDDLDKAFRYDAGSWMTLMGVFRRADLQGCTDFLEMLTNLFPVLNQSTEVPAIMKEVVAEGKRGIYNLRGLYDYSEDEAKSWERSFSSFNGEINQLAENYSTKNIENFVKKSQQ